MSPRTQDDRINVSHPAADGGSREKDELYAEARRLKIEGRSRMSQAELAAAVRQASVMRKPR